MTKEEIEALAVRLDVIAKYAEANAPGGFTGAVEQAAAALRQLSKERESDRQYLRALFDTAQWNSEAKGDVADKAAWSSLAASIIAHRENMNAMASN